MKRIVIELDDTVYNWIVSTEAISTGTRNCKDVLSKVLVSVKQAKEIPEDCGRLISANKLQATLQDHHDFFVNAYGGFCNLPREDKSRVDEISHCISEVINSKTII